jgi:Filamentous haemagglutinin family outer membrane protein
LNESGLDYNDPTSSFFQSYLRGQAAIAALFPSKGASGQPITYSGNLTMFSSENAKQQTSDSSILTDFGGGISILVPGGETIVGVTGVAPGPHAGILTQGSGNINVYSHGSILLGESRILTTFGGNIVMWSATGDINAGIGAKGTIIFAPPGIVYDNYADILLSPTVPSSGAGIGTLDPIPEVPPGDLNLIAPEGTIDAGEAGIRASGNANLAARVIVNAANITVAGKTTGIPTIVSPNVAAVTAASNAVGATNNVAQEIVKQQTAGSDQQGIPSIITVEILGYGGGDSD